MKKRLLAVLLSLCMVFGSTGPVYAAGAEGAQPALEAGWEAEAGAPEDDMEVIEAGVEESDAAAEAANVAAEEETAIESVELDESSSEVTEAEENAEIPVSEEEEQPSGDESEAVTAEGEIQDENEAPTSGEGEVETPGDEEPPVHHYTVLFDGNGAEGSMAALTDLEYGAAYILPANSFERAGYSYGGWNTASDGSGVSFADGSEIVSLTDEDQGVVTFYAQWKKASYAINYVLSGGTNHGENPAVYTYFKAVTLQAPTRKGYAFQGWYSDAGYTEKVTGISKETSGDMTFYAKWTANKYTVKFDGNGSTSGSMKAMTGRRYGKTFALTANAFKRKGYSFKGWNTKKDGSGKTYANKASVKNLTAKDGATVTLYAQWKKVKYTITYQLGGGKNSTSNPAAYYITTKTITLKNPTRSGYRFAGWYKDSAFKKKVTGIAKGSTGNKTFYAKWEVPVKSISLNKKSVSITTGKTYTLTAKIKPTNATIKTVTWKSSNPKVATVTAKGVVKAVAASGTCVITATTKDGKKTASCKVTVKKNRYYEGSLSDYDVYDEDYGGPGLQISSVTYDGTNMVLKAVVLNKSVFDADYFKWITITLYDDTGYKVVATHKFTNVGIHLDAYDKKYMTFTFPASAIKQKNCDLRLMKVMYMTYQYNYYYLY